MSGHLPVLLEETLSWLGVRPGGIYADLTLGLGGHAAGILKRSAPDGVLVGVDRDEDALDAARKKLMSFADRLVTIHADYADAPGLIREAGYAELDGFVMDLGVSAMQLREAGRGFSFTADAPLDMRMDRSKGMTAAELIGGVSEAELAGLIRDYGEERWAAAVARRIVERRAASGIKTTLELAETVKGAIPRRFWPPKAHPATRTFQALRIAVNDELGSLGRTLGPMLGMLRPGGRAAVLSYHSLEDRLVKQTFKAWAKGCDCPPDFPKCVCGKKPRLRVLTARPVLPSKAEVDKNPSARSAKLRAAERL